jgi:hypothetical protein
MVSLPSGFQSVHNDLEGLGHHSGSSLILIHLPSDFDLKHLPDSLLMQDGVPIQPNFALDGKEVRIIETVDTDLLESYKILFSDRDTLKVGSIPSKLWTIVLDE